MIHEKDEKVLEPFNYLNQIPGKDIRGEMIDCFAHWIPLHERKLRIIKDIIGSLHNASLLVDDIEDSSKLRRGVPVAHSIYGVANTINCANYVYFLALEMCNSLNCPKAMHVFVQELLNLHRGQGQDILWREQCRCPTEAQYKQMVLDKTGGLFRLAVGLMQALALSSSDSGSNDSSSGSNDGSSSSSSNSSSSGGSSSSHAQSSSSSGVGSDSSSGSAAADYTPLLNLLALYFQIRDDFLNVSSLAYMQTKSFCEDLTEGKFSFPVIHAVNVRPNDTRLLNILRQRTEDVDVKRHAVKWMVEVGSMEHTRSTLRTLKVQVMDEISLMGGHTRLATLLEKLDAQLDVDDLVSAAGGGAESL